MEIDLGHELELANLSGPGPAHLGGREIAALNHAERIEQLLEPARDPLVRRMVAGELSSLGRTYLDRGDLVRAGGLFEAALGVRPGDASSSTNLAVVRAARGDYAGAEQLVNDVLAREPLRQVARVNSGRYRLQLDDLDGAERQFQLARAGAPDDSAPLCGLARVALRRGLRAEAKSLVAQALARAPSDPEARALEEELKK